MKRCRTGSMMIETLAALTLITFVLVGISQLLVTTSRHQRMLETRRIAVLTCANLMEQALALPFDRLVQEQVDSLARVEADRQRLNNMEAVFRLSETDESPQGTLIQLEVRFDNAGERETQRLFAWKYSTEVPP